MLLLLVVAVFVILLLVAAAAARIAAPLQRGATIEAETEDIYDLPNWEQNHPDRELIPRGRRPDESRHFYFHVHGVRRRYGKEVNPHYKARQVAIKSCTRGDPVLLEREPSNQYDGNAILVRLGNGEDAGYVPSEIAVTLAPQLDAGEQVRAEVDWINAPDAGFGYGLKVRVGILLSDAELQAKAARRTRKSKPASPPQK